MASKERHIAKTTENALQSIFKFALLVFGVGTILRWIGMFHEYGHTEDGK